MVRVGSGTLRRAVLADVSSRLKPLVVAIGLALGAGAGTPAMAATYTVTNLSDSLPGSLRAAVTLANATPGVPDVITFGAGVTGTIPLATSITVTDQLTINGPGASLLTITPPAGSSALVNSNQQLAISGVTFAGGSMLGGAVDSQGIQAILTLQSCVFSNNSTLLGAVNNLFGSVFISGCTFNNNTGTLFAGAVTSAGGTLSITNSTFSGNIASVGAISSIHDTFVMTNSTISGNATGTVQVGGIYLQDTAVPAEIRNSTLSDNVAPSGQAGAILVVNFPPASSALNLTSTIVANSTSFSGTIDIASPGGTTTINATNSLIENVGVGTINGTNTANLFGADPVLGPLQNNGGPTKTHALLSGSPAIDTGSNPLALTTDQRGPGFARTVGFATDRGAYEVQAPAAVAVAAAPIPALSEWGTVALAALLGGVTLLTGLGRRRRDS
jgi:IPTL-CTERM motif